jgi:hypothetical protein
VGFVDPRGLSQVEAVTASVCWIDGDLTSPSLVSLSGFGTVRCTGAPRFIWVKATVEVRSILTDHWDPVSSNSRTCTFQDVCTVTTLPTTGHTGLYRVKIQALCHPCTQGVLPHPHDVTFANALLRRLKIAYGQGASRSYYALN